jgi:hypothetical protein
MEITRVALNNWLRQRPPPAPLAGIIETANAVEWTNNAGIWAAPNGTPLTVDGIHPNAAGSQLLMQAIWDAPFMQAAQLSTPSMTAGNYFVPANLVIGGVTNQIVLNNSSPTFGTVMDNTEIVSNLIVLSGASIPSNTANFVTNSCYGSISNYVLGSTITNSCGQRALFWLDLFSAGGTSVSGTNTLYLVPGNAVVTQLVELVVCSSAQTSMKLGPIPLNPGDAIMSSNMVDSSGNGANTCTNVTGAWLIGM